MLTRRDFLQVTAATATFMGGAPFYKLAAHQKITQNQKNKCRKQLEHQTI